MKLTYADVLTMLPVDATLQDYLTRCGLPLPPGLDWTDAVSTSRALIAAIESCPDTMIRDTVIAVQTATQLAHQSGCGDVPGGHEGCGGGNGSGGV